MSKRNRNKGNRGNPQFSAGPPPMPAPQGSGTPAGAPPGGAPPTVTRNGWIILILIGVALAAAFFYFTRETDGPTPGGAGTDAVNVVIDTSMGSITVELNPSRAPITVANFLKYVDAKHYDGTIFHRVMADFMIQGGGFEPGMREKADRFDPIRNEAGNGLSNQRGAIAMARTNHPDSATAQFFINTVDNSRLDRRGDNAGYAVFGKVLHGMDVVDKIRRVATTTRSGHENVPVQDVLIKSVRRAD